MPEENINEEAILLQNIEQNDKLDTIAKTTEASVLEQSNTTEAIKDLTPAMEALISLNSELLDVIKEKNNTDLTAFSGVQTISLKGDKGDKPTKKEITSLIEPLLPSDAKLTKLIKPLIPEPIKGEKGDDYVLTAKDKKEIAKGIKVPVVEKVIEKFTTVEQPITIDKTKTEIKEVAKYEDADTIAGKLNTLTKAIDFKVIKNFPDRQAYFGGNTQTGISAITGLIEEGTNVTITGQGTTVDPYVINATGGGSQDLQQVTDEGNTTTNDIIAGAILAGGPTSPGTTNPFLQVYDGSNGVYGGFYFGDDDSFGVSYNTDTTPEGLLTYSGRYASLVFLGTASGAFSGSFSAVNTNPNGQTLDFPTASGTLALSVNGNTADSAGNITISTSGLDLEVDGTPNGDQTLLNLISGTGIILTDGGTGGVTIDADLTFQVNGSPTPTQTLLNLVAGTGITITDSGAGDVTFDATGGGGSSPFALENVSSIFSTPVFPITSTSTDSFFALTNAGDGTDSVHMIAIGSGAAQNASGANNLISLGQESGQNAGGAGHSIFLGTASGNGATSAAFSIFLGNGSGVGAANASNSNFIGTSAGGGATNALNSSFLGAGAGGSAVNAANSIFIGNNAGAGDTVNNTSSGTSILIGDGTSTGGFKNSIGLGAGATNTAVNEFLIDDSYTRYNFRGLPYTMPSVQATANQVLTATSVASGIATLGWVTFPTLALETDGTPNGDQTLLNLIGGVGIILTDGGTGGVTIDADITFQVNGTPTPTQTLLNLVAGTGITITDSGAGDVTFDVTGGGGTTIYTGDGILSGSRTVDFGGNDLNLTDVGSGDKVGIFFDTPALRSALGAPHSSGNTSLYVDNNSNTVVIEAGSLQIPAGATAGYVLTDVGGTGIASWQPAGGASYTFSTGLTDTAGTITANLSTGISGGQSAIGGTAAGDDLTLSSTSNATKGNIFFGTASTYDELNDRFGISQTTPLSKLHINRNDIRVTQSDAYGITLQNATASIVTSGQDVQYSPAVVLRGTEWLTTTGASHTLDYRMFNRPVSGTTAARGGFLIQQSLNGAAYTDLFEIGQTISNQSGYNMRINNATVFALGGGVVQFYGSSSGMGFYNSTGSVAFQTIDANGRHALTPANLTTAATINTWNLAQTWNNASGDYTAMRIAITNTNSASTSRLFNLLVGGTSVFSVDTAGGTHFGEGANLIFGTTTGTKIGTATSQKLSLWNATPDVQPTTAITAAAFTANTSGIVDDTATFGGYTIGQIVAALKRIGALA